MSTWWAMARRELGVYFVSPMAYVILTALLFLAGFAFVGSMASAVESRLPAEYGGTLQAIAWILVMTSPLITMRLIAEENSRGTIELTLTAPVSEAQFVLAKFSAAVIFLFYLLLPTAGYAAVVAQYGQMDLGAVLCGYLGVILVVALAYSIGLFISALCSNQVTAAIVSFAVMFVLFCAGFFGALISRDSVWARILDYVDMSRNFMDFFRGILDSARVAYVASAIFFFLFLTTRVVESRRWR